MRRIVEQSGAQGVQVSEEVITMEAVQAASDVTALYQGLLGAWNAADAITFASLFDEDACVTGFDGSQMRGPDEIGSALAQIFRDHAVARYVSKVREVRLLTPEVALLRAVAGMIPPGGSDINPAVNAIQSLVAVRRAGRWRIALFQNTPAQFHGRSDLAIALTDELREVAGDTASGVDA